MRLPRTGAVQKNPKESMGTKTVFALPRAVKAASGALAFAPPSLPRRLSAYFSAQSFPHQDMRAALLVEGSPARRIAAARVKIGGTHLGVQDDARLFRRCRRIRPKIPVRGRTLLRGCVLPPRADGLPRIRGVGRPRRGFDAGLFP